MIEKSGMIRRPKAEMWISVCSANVSGLQPCIHELSQFQLFQLSDSGNHVDPRKVELTQNSCFVPTLLAPHLPKSNRNSFLAFGYFCSQELR